MNALDVLGRAAALLPAALMLLSIIGIWSLRNRTKTMWAVLVATSSIASLSALASLGLQLLGQSSSVAGPNFLPGLTPTLPAAWMALLVQSVGWVIASFSSRYLHGERHQPG